MGGGGQPLLLCSEAQTSQGCPAAPDAGAPTGRPQGPKSENRNRNLCGELGQNHVKTTSHKRAFILETGQFSVFTPEGMLVVRTEKGPHAEPDEFQGGPSGGPTNSET